MSGNQLADLADRFKVPRGRVVVDSAYNPQLAYRLASEFGFKCANAIKCRPPGNHNPTAQELATCALYLARQVALVQPKIILLMGRFAVQSVLQTTEPIGKLRGQVHTYQGVPVVVTYHPAYLLRNPADKAKAWADLVLALKMAQG
jgi:DNA polymerase